MNTLIRRLFVLAAAAGATAAGWTAWQRRRQPDAAVSAPGAPAARVPFAFTDITDETTNSTANHVPASSVPPAPDLPTWVAPVDGECPDGYPIKANASSKIFHMPGGRFYDRTVPERCYADPADAEADGYRRAKA